MSRGAPTQAGDAAAASATIEGRTHDLGGFSVRRLLPHRAWPMVGPWIFFDHFGPVDFAPGPGVDVRPHPHVNLATVTYLFDGEIFHRDSLGSRQAIRPGDVNLMIAGRGIVHSERETAAARQSRRRLHGLQLWLALPASAEEVEPSFHHYPAAGLPALDVDGVPVRVMVGSAYGRQSPVETLSPTLYLEARPAAGRCLSLPAGVAELGVYVVDGAVECDGVPLRAGAMRVLPRPAATLVTASEDSVVVVIGGDPVGPRHIWWNFVSSRQERIEQARQDWLERRFPAVPGDTDEFIPLPDDD